MPNTLLTPTIIAREALRILDNNCVMGKLVYRGYEEEFEKKINGYEVGTTISVRRPTDYTVRTGRTASIQDVTEGSFPLVVNTQIGVDFQFTSQELTLSIGELSDRAIKPAMVQLANQIDGDLLGLYNLANNWVGATTTSAIDSFADFAKAPERLDLGAVPQDDRSAVLSPTDTWAMLGSQTALFMNEVARGAYRNASLGQIGGIDTYMSQNVKTHNRGSISSTFAHGNTTTYAATLNSNTMSLGLSVVASGSFNQGDVFTISGTFAVNPVTKATLPYLQQFVIVSSTGGIGTVTVTITPPIIPSGAFQTVSAAPVSGSVVNLCATCDIRHNRFQVLSYCGARFL